MPLLDRLIIVARRSTSHDRNQQALKCMSTHTECNNNNRVSSESLIRKSVFISQSMNVFTNLALEDWLYRNYDFSNHHVLFLWRNNPCIVFGRHQNPWKECNVQVAEKKDIVLARRNSGGGTVYHDNGNLNLSFFTPREKYDRKHNLHIITRALFREWCLKSMVNKREDIVIEGDYKVSGTAAKLGRPNAYHHCTLLVDVNKKNLSLALKRQENGIVTNATTSIRSPIKNLIDMNSDIKIDKLMTAIGREYLCTNIALEGKECKLSQQQLEFQFINPTEDCFPGLDKLISEFRSWNWNFGKTPKFTVNRTFEITAHDNEVHCLKLRLEIENGIIEEVVTNLPNGLILSEFDQDASAFANFCGMRYNHEIIENIIATIRCKSVRLRTIQSEGRNNAIVMQ